MSQSPSIQSRTGDSLSDGVPYSGPHLPKACENCRVRKIRCNRAVPCSNCQTANLTCRPAIKSIEKAPREVSSYNEKHFKSIHDRLSKIETAIRELNLTSQSPNSVVSINNTIQNSSPTGVEPTFQGETSFSSQSVHATLSAELTASEALGNNQSSEFSISLSSLKSLLRGQYVSSKVNDLYLPQTQISTDPELPPASFVIALLKRVKAKPPLFFLHSASRDHSQLERLCQAAYFPTHPLPDGSITLINGLLYYLIKEYRQLDDPDLTTSDCEAYSGLCERNLCRGIQKYQRLTVPSLVNIQCLLLGALKAQEDSKPLLCCTFVSSAAIMCQSLGYHRKASVQNDMFEIAEVKRHVFWFIYMMEKCLSLTFGRASVFQDYDIDVEKFTPSSDPKIYPWDMAMLGLIELARLQGQIYDRLYSARALGQRLEERSRTVEELLDEFSTWESNFKKIDTTNVHSKDDLDRIIGGSDFSYYSSLTLLYRGNQPSGTPMKVNRQCFDLAKLSLQIYVKDSTILESGDVSRWTIYVNWMVLYSSFAPFIVVFTHAIISNSQEDIDLLEQVLKALEAAKYVSEAGDRLYQVCKAMIQVAKTFITLQPHSLNGLRGRQAESIAAAGFPESSQGFDGEQGVYGAGTREELDVRAFEVDHMSTFLESWLGENNTLNGIWQPDFSNFHN